MTAIDFNWKAADGEEIFAREWRPEVPIRAAVALVHGLGEHCGRYEHVAGAFNQAGIGVVALDLRGHGKTPGIRGHAPSYDVIMDDIQHLLQETAQRYPGKPCFLYGHSMGGNLVLYYTLKRKPAITGVISTSPGLAVATPIPPVKNAMARLMHDLWPSFTLDNGLDLSGLSHDPEVAKKYSADPLVHGKISARLAVDMIDAGVWIREHAAEFPLPLLLLQGDSDRLVSPPATREFAEKAPANLLTFQMWKNGYHELHNEPEKDQVINVMIGWMEQRLDGV